MSEGEGEKQPVLQLEELLAELKKDFELCMTEVLGELDYDNDKAQEWRGEIMKKCSDQVRARTQLQYKFSLTVMVFEKTGYNRALSTMLTRTDGMINAEYRGSKIY